MEKSPSFPANIVLFVAVRLISWSVYIQGRHVSEKVNFQGDDSEIKECGRGCKQLDPSGSVPPHVTALFGEVWYPSAALL